MNSIDIASQKLLAGENVCIPTETVYGLAGIANNDIAVARIFALKGRPNFNPLILHCYSLDQVMRYSEPNKFLPTIAEKFWPGPLTVICNLKENADVSKLGLAGLSTIAIRIPKLETTLQILKNIEIPIFAPSANISNTTSATTYEDVLKNLPDVYIVKDNNASTVGIESTIVDLTHEPHVILRYGYVTAEEISLALNVVVSTTVSYKVIAPGMSKKHYAPSIPLKINVAPSQVSPLDALLAFGDVPDIPCKKTLNLSKSGNLIEAAANLYKMIHQLDNPEFASICVTPVPHTGIGIAINDRISRAATR